MTRQLPFVVGILGRFAASCVGWSALRVARSAQKTVRLRLSGGTLPPALAARQPVRDGDALTIALGDYADLEQILAEVRQAGASVLELEVLQPDLQDVFLQVMTRH